MLSKKPQGGPRRDHESNQQREEHGCRGAYGDGAHVRPHQAADKGHWQNCRDHCEGGQDGRVAYFGDRFHRDFAHRPAVALREAEVPHHVLDDDDGVVHKDADAEDQGEECDAIDGVTEEVEYRHGERERHWNGEQDDTRLTPAEEERDQQGYRQRRQQQVLEQFVGLVLGGLSVVAGCGNRHVVGHGHALHPVDAGEDGIRDIGGIGALALSHGYRYCRVLPRCRRTCIARVCRAKYHVVRGVSGAVDDLLGNVA